MLVVRPPAGVARQQLRHLAGPEVRPLAKLARIQNLARPAKQLAAQPGVLRRAKANLIVALPDLLGNDPAHRLAQDVLRHSVADLLPRRQREAELDQTVIQE